MPALYFPKAHTYGPRRPDGYCNCSWCTPNLRVRVPANPTGKAVHSAVHEKYGGTTAGGFTTVFQSTF